MTQNTNVCDRVYELLSDSGVTNARVSELATDIVLITVGTDVNQAAYYQLIGGCCHAFGDSNIATNNEREIVILR